MHGHKCKYHVNQDAISKCELCGALLCLECKIIHRTVGNSTGTSSSMEICPECNVDLANKGKNPLFFIIAGITLVFITVMVVFMMMATIADNEEYGMDTPIGFMVIFIIVPVGMCGLLGYFYFNKIPQHIAEAEQKRSIALQALHGSSTYKP